MALLGMFNVHRHGAINSAAILLYALTCCISGYVSSHFYRQIGGERWVWNIILTTSLFSGEDFPFPSGSAWTWELRTYHGTWEGQSETLRERIWGIGVQRIRKPSKRQESISFE